MIACTQKIDGFKDFLDGKEIKYPGVITKVFVMPGNGRIGIGWSPSPDPSVVKYKIYWNNYRDSMEVAATTHNTSDTVKAIINNLQEYTYSFFVYSIDDKGNKSIPAEIQNARVYGSSFRNSLMNRSVDVSNPYDLVNADGTEIILNFLSTDTTNALTHIRYQNNSGGENVATILPNQSQVTLSDYKYGSKIAYQSEFIPTKLALDSFEVNLVDTVPKVEFVIRKLDKRLFKTVHMANDANPWDGNVTYLARLWDGTTTARGWDQIWHSGGDKPLPHTFTFDMGGLFRRLTYVEVIGRDCCHNPLDYEIWGIEDITNAETPLPSNDPGWKDQAIAKGWKLLKEVSITGNGVGPYNVDFPADVPRVRYIRFRIKRVASGESAYSNLSQLTFEQKK